MNAHLTPRRLVAWMAIALAAALIAAPSAAASVGRQPAGVARAEALIPGTSVKTPKTWPIPAGVRRAEQFIPNQGGHAAPGHVVTAPPATTDWTITIDAFLAAVAVAILAVAAVLAARHRRNYAHQR